MALKVICMIISFQNNTHKVSNAFLLTLTKSILFILTRFRIIEFEKNISRKYALYFTQNSFERYELK